MITQIFKNLFRRKTRTLLTVSGIAVGVAMIVAMGAMGEGLRTGYASMFSGSGANLVMMQKGSYDITLSGVDEDVISQVAAMPEVASAGGVIVGNVNVSGSFYFYVFGYDPKGFAIQRFKPVAGRDARRIAPRSSSREIMLGKQASEALKLNVGDMIRLPGGAFRIVGIYATGSGFEDAASVVSLADAQLLLQKYRQVGAVQIKLKDPRQIDQVRARLERQYPKLTISRIVPGGQRPTNGRHDARDGVGHCAPGRHHRRRGHDQHGDDERVRADARDRHAARVGLEPLARGDHGDGRERALLGALGGLLGCAAGAALVIPMSTEFGHELFAGQALAVAAGARDVDGDCAGLRRRAISGMVGLQAHAGRGVAVRRWRGSESQISSSQISNFKSGCARARRCGHYGAGAGARC